MKKEYIFAAGAIIFWSTIAVVSKLLLDKLSSIQLLWASAFFAALFLLIVNIVTGNIKKMKEYKFKDYVTMVLIGLPGTFFYYIFYYSGADLMPASQAFIVNYMWPIMSVVFACIILKEEMTLKKGIAIAVSFIGVMIVTGQDIAKLNSNTLLGATLCLSGAVCYGVFTALNQKFKYEKRICMMINYTVTFLLTTIINGMRGELFVPDFVQVLGFLWNGELTMALASTLWMYALDSGKTAQISNLAYITPFLSLVWTSLILKETITVNAVVGLCVIVVGILIQFIHKRRVH